MINVMGLNIFDIVVLVLILLLSIKGLLNGFTKELFSAIGLIGGIFAASYFSGIVAQYAHDNFLNSLSMPLLSLIAKIVIFVVVWFVASLIGKGLYLISDSEFTSTTSRLAGMFVKMVTLFLIFSIIAFVSSTKPQISERFKDTLSQSKLYPLLKDAGAMILNMVNTNSVAAISENNTSDSEQNVSKEVKSSVSNEQNSTTNDKSNNKEEETATAEANSSATIDENNETNSTK